jgi:hypothetical protein
MFWVALGFDAENTAIERMVSISTCSNDASRISRRPPNRPAKTRAASNPLRLPPMTTAVFEAAAAGARVTTRLSADREALSTGSPGAPSAAEYQAGEDDEPEQVRRRMDDDPEPDAAGSLDGDRVGQDVAEARD